MKELLAEFVSYLASEKGLARNTIVAYSQDLEHFFSLLQKRGISDIAAVTEGEVIAFLSQLKSKTMQAAASAAC